MLQPLSRPEGSSHVLRFSGLVSQGNALAVYPKANGEFSSDAVGGNVRVVRLALGDVTNMADMTRQLPSSAYDDTTPAGDHPVVPMTSGVPASLADILNANDLDITLATWAQNTYVTIQALDAASKAILAAVDPLLTKICFDTGPSSGLGLETGLPVLCLAVDLGAVPLPFRADFLIEVRDSRTR